MIIYRFSQIKRRDLREDPTFLFVFEDNLKGVDAWNRRLVWRDEQNAIGIPTEQAPGIPFTDAAFGSWIKLTEEPFQRIRHHHFEHGVVVFPASGIGTGRAMLKLCAPAIWAQLNQRLTRLGIKNG